MICFQIRQSCFLRCLGKNNSVLLGGVAGVSIRPPCSLGCCCCWQGRCLRYDVKFMWDRPGVCARQVCVAMDVSLTAKECLSLGFCFVLNDSRVFVFWHITQANKRLAIANFQLVYWQSLVLTVWSQYTVQKLVKGVGRLEALSVGTFTRISIEWSALLLFKKYDYTTLNCGCELRYIVRRIDDVIEECHDSSSSTSRHLRHCASLV